MQIKYHFIFHGYFIERGHFKTSKENRKCYILHAICSLILILDFNSKFKLLQNTKVPKAGNKVPKMESKALNLENKV